LFMVRTLSLVRLLAHDLPAPELILARLNNELASENPSSMFVTLLCAMYQSSTRRLTLASGGHTRPLLLRHPHAPSFILDALGTSWCLEPNRAFESTSVALEPMATLLL